MDDVLLRSVGDPPQVRRSPSGPAFAARTPGLPLGPFYPVSPPLRASATLSGAEDAGAVPLRLTGRVRTTDGAAVAGATVEFWQADEHGGYVHASAPPGPGASGTFAGYAATRTDDTGRYALRSRRPGPYRDGAGFRAPHIHVQVSGARDRLVSQMFFEGEPSNDTDRWLAVVRDRSRLFGRVVSAEDAPLLEIEWDIVLASG